MTNAQSGWYRDPRVAGGMLAYWDGSTWTDHRQPLPADWAKLEARGKPGISARVLVALILLFPTCGLSLLALIPTKNNADKRRAELATQSIYV